MLNHVSLGVTDLARAGAFYDTVFAPLGFIRCKTASDREIAYGPPGAAGFWLYPQDAGKTVVGAGTHLAFTARDPAAVDAFGRATAALGAKTLRGAGPHPDLSPTYYGAIVLDPDGHKIEILVDEA